jgi:hypothetical protein
MWFLYGILLYILYKIISYREPFHERFNSYHISAPLSQKYKKTFNIKPRQTLPPGTVSIDTKFKNKRLESNQTDYCEDNPTCYPCPNWKHIGAPMCLA